MVVPLRMVVVWDALYIDDDGDVHCEVWPAQYRMLPPDVTVCICGRLYPDVEKAVGTRVKTLYSFLLPGENTANDKKLQQRWTDGYLDVIF
jgi:hypothetical protein